MLVKVIVTLVILIAIGALGFTLLGEGVFDSVDRAAAANFAEDARDLDQMIEIYEALTSGDSAFEGADAAAATPDSIATTPELSAFLTSDAGQNVLDAPVDPINVLFQGDNGDYFLTQEVSGDVCREANVIFNVAADNTVAPTDVDFATPADVDAAAAGLEGVCFEDTVAGNFQVVYNLGQ